MEVRHELPPPERSDGRRLPCRSGRQERGQDGCLCSGFGVRISDKGGKTFIAFARFGGKPTRLSIGRVGQISLHDAREKARLWLDMAQQGRHPLEEKKAAEKAEREKQVTMFGTTCEEFIKKFADLPSDRRTCPEGVFGTLRRL